MQEAIKQVLETINSYGYKAYVVGGYVRDYLLKIESNDIDICTNATPKKLQEIFKELDLSSQDYGSVTLMHNNIRFEITTFRKEIGYVDHRRPLEVEYIDDLYEDLQRRDFTINTICMNSNFEVIDLLNGQEDLEKRLIKAIGNAEKKFEEDSLRILRAIRFATSLGFALSEDISAAIIKKKHLLRDLSYHRKKEELDKIFSSSKVKEGIDLLLQFHLEEDLQLPKLKEVKNTDSLISVWAVLDAVDIYPFNNSEKQLIDEIHIVLEKDNLDPKVLYDYGLYPNSVAGSIKGIDKKKITEAYNSLIIHSKKELQITSEEIMDILHKKPGKYLKDIYNDIEQKVLYGKLDNNYDMIRSYILQKY